MPEQDQQQIGDYIKYPRTTEEAGIIHQLENSSHNKPAEYSNIVYQFSSHISMCSEINMLPRNVAALVVYGSQTDSLSKYQQLIKKQIDFIKIS